MDEANFKRGLAHACVDIIANSGVIEVNAALNGICPECLSAEVFSMINIAALIHLRKNFACDQEFIDWATRNLVHGLQSVLAPDPLHDMQPATGTVQ